MKRLKKALALLLTLIIISSLCIGGAVSGALQLEIEEKFVPSAGEQEPKPHSEMADGEVYAYTRITGTPLPSTEFSVDLAAIGQQFRVESVVSRRYNIVMLLDVSNSMKGDRLTNMIKAANEAAAKLVGGGNKIAAVSFATNPDTERGLSTKGIEFYEGSGEDTRGTIDKIGISLRSSSQGGTNIQKALRTGYSILSQANDPEAVPVIILLSDGAPTYYCTDVDNPNSGTDGAGSASSATNTAYTIAQAAYYKVLMPELQIFTIPFALESDDPDIKFANATLNPTDANIAVIYKTTTTRSGNQTVTEIGFEEAWPKALKTVDDSAIRSKMSKDYVAASYSAVNSAESLSKALQSAIVHMQGYNPIVETTGADGKLTDSSYLWARYQIGTGFKLAGDTITVLYNGSEYAFERAGDSYVYQPTNISNTKVEKLQLKVTDTGLIEWKIPASVLPCNPPGGDTQVPPIVLRFNLDFDLTAPGLEPKLYPTSTSCFYTFYPAKENPYYYAGSTEVTNLGTSKFYGAEFQPTSVNSKPSFSRADSVAGLASGFVLQKDVSFKSNGYVTNSDGTPNNVSINYDNATYKFVDFEEATATAQFSYKNSFSSNASSYTVSDFKDGTGRQFSDAKVTNIAVTDSLTRTANITVSYDYSGGNARRSLVFQNVRFSNTSTVQAKIRRTSSGFIFVSYTYYVTQIGNTTLPNSYKISGSGGNYDHSDTETYVFGNVSRANYSLSNGNYVATVNATRYQYSNTASASANYYTSTLEVVMPSAVSYSVSGDGKTLTVAVNNKEEAKYKAGPNVTFEPISGGYTITQRTNGVTQVTTYVASSSSATKTVRIYTARNGVDATGQVMLLSNPAGAIKLKDTIESAEQVAQEVGAAVTLKSVYGSEFTTVKLRNVAEAYLYFKVTQPISNPAFTLAASDAGLLKSATVTKFEVKNAGGYDTLGTAIPENVLPGEYRIRYTVEFNAPAPTQTATRLLFDNMTFTWKGYDGLLRHHPDYLDQQVRVSFDTTMGH